MQTSQLERARRFRALHEAPGCFVVPSAEQILSNARDIANVTDLPVSADVENGWSSEPGDLPSVIHRAAQAGLVGVSIEDVDHMGISTEVWRDHRVEIPTVIDQAVALAKYPVWEDATERGFIGRHYEEGLGELISVTVLGREHLAKHRPHR